MRAVGGLGRLQSVQDYLTKLKDLVLTPKYNTPTKLHDKALVFSRPRLGNPLIVNLFKYCFNKSSIQDMSKLRETYLHRIQNAIKSVGLAESIIQNFALKKIPRNGVVLFHGNSSILADIINSAKKEKNFDVLVLSSSTELISELKRHKINFHVFPDTAARIAVKSADLVLLGCHVITPSKVIHSIGSELIAEIAHKRNVPVYVCSPSLFFSQTYVLPPHKPVKNKSFVSHNYRYEQVDPALLTGIISDIGIYNHKSFVIHLESEMPWIFTSSFS